MSKGLDKAMALMVYETWLLNGATAETMPKLSLRKWCNKQLKKPLFPIESKSEQMRRWPLIRWLFAK